MKKPLFILSIFFLLLIFKVNVTTAQETTTADQAQKAEAVVQEIIEEKTISVPDANDTIYQKLRLKITKGSLKGSTITIENGKIPTANIPKYKVGDKVIITITQNPNGKNFFQITGYVRKDAIILLFVLFIITVLTVTQLQGFTSLIGMFLTFEIIFKFVLPQLMAGRNPILIVFLASAFIIPTSFYLSHGLNQKTHMAIIGTAITLIITSILALAFVNLTKLTGFGSDEAMFLQMKMQAGLNLQNLLLAGITISLLGILDDITVSQSAIVFQLHDTDKSLSRTQLYNKAMSVGKDHISSMVNTLILVYAGASLPLFLLFTSNTDKSFSSALNLEMIAEEIVRTLVGSIGLVLAVPITTLIAVWWSKRHIKQKTKTFH